MKVIAKNFQPSFALRLFSRSAICYSLLLQYVMSYREILCVFSSSSSFTTPQKTTTAFLPFSASSFFKFSYNVANEQAKGGKNKEIEMSTK